MNKTSLTLDEVTVTGDIYNGASYYGQSAPSLEVKASEEWISFQNTYFTISEYFDIRQVANKVFYNGHNDISVTMMGAQKPMDVTMKSS
ncbi:hypothetical protein Pelo_17654 [Pelomyxa schiedti]|nr:hypothetical protein Pelo_17654 [Pelomyxa schiedti]